jgi:hypothetical protein
MESEAEGEIDVKAKVLLFVLSADKRWGSGQAEGGGRRFTTQTTRGGADPMTKWKRDIGGPVAVLGLASRQPGCVSRRAHMAMPRQVLFGRLTSVAPVPSQQL